MLTTQQLTRTELPPIPTVDSSLEKAFLAALLFTGNRRLAEAAVLAAIETPLLNCDSDQTLLCHTLSISLGMPREIKSLALGEGESADSALPKELWAVLLLPRLSRQCFVLRMLLSLPCWKCASLLKISIGEVGSNAGLAASMLASF